MKFCLAFLFVFGLASLLEAAEGARLEKNCRMFTAKVNVAYTTDNCTSPIGLCTKGKIYGDPILYGTTGYVVEKVAGSAEDPTMAASLVYSGTMKITTQYGVITVTDLGSTNGTFVGGKRLDPKAPAAVPPDETIRFGRASIYQLLDPPGMFGYLEVLARFGM